MYNLRMDSLGVVRTLLGCLVLLCLTLMAAAQDFDREVCQQPPATSRCRAAIPMWYFNSTTEMCEEFIWGGCPGSLNRFPNRQTCIHNCHPETCALAADVGGCRANIKLWFYDVSHRKCHEFSYGGCGGNENKFRSQHVCETACAGTNLLCELGDSYQTVGYQSVHEEYRQKEWFTYSCEKRCRETCTEDHSWGACHAFSTRKRWYTCECYLYDRTVSELEFDDDTSGTTRNRMCEAPAPEVTTEVAEEVAENGWQENFREGNKAKDKNRRPVTGHRKDKGP